MALKDRPNNIFGWFLDNESHHGARICILADRASTDTTNKEGAYDTYNESSITDGIRIHYHAKYPEVSELTDDLAGFGSPANSAFVDTWLHSAVLDYVKARVEEDNGAFEKSVFFMNKYKLKIHQYPHRKSGVRQLSVPKS